MSYKKRPQLTDEQRQIVEKNIGLAHMVANRHWVRASYLKVEKDDLDAEAYYALAIAVQCFDPNRGYEFTTYAAACINGHIRHYFRDHCRPIRLPRSAQKRGEDLRVLSLNKLMSNRTGREKEWIDTITSFDSDLTVLMVREFASSLPPIERHVLLQRLLREKTQREIGRELGRSQVFVYRMLQTIGHKYLAWNQTV